MEQRCDGGDRSTSRRWIASECERGHKLVWEHSRVSSYGPWVRLHLYPDGDRERNVAVWLFPQCHVRRRSLAVPRVVSVLRRSEHRLF